MRIESRQPKMDGMSKKYRFIVVSHLQDWIGLLSCQTDKLMVGTKFSDYLGLKHYKKDKNKTFLPSKVEIFYLQGGRELKNFRHCLHIQTKTVLELSDCKLNQWLFILLIFAMYQNFKMAIVHVSAIVLKIYVKKKK